MATKCHLALELAWHNKVWRDGKVMTEYFLALESRDYREVWMVTKCSLALELAWQSIVWSEVREKTRYSLALRMAQ